MSIKNKRAFWWTVFLYSILPLAVSAWSTYHVLDFFQLTNNYGISIGIALTFEIGALVSLASLTTYDKVNKNVVWFLFITLTLYQCMGNSYSAYNFLCEHMKINPQWITNFTEFFGMDEMELVTCKRVIALMSGLIFPAFSLASLHFLMSFIMVSLGYKEPKAKKIKITTPDEPTVLPIDIPTKEDTDTITEEIPLETPPETVVDTPEPEPDYPWEKKEEDTDNNNDSKPQSISIGGGKNHNLQYKK
jgi:hypothetical protein